MNTDAVKAVAVTLCAAVSGITSTALTYQFGPAVAVVAGLVSMVFTAAFVAVSLFTEPE